MGETPLVEAKIVDSVTLIRDLDARGDGPTAAAWYFYDDAEQWRLLMAGPAFDALLPKQEPVAYRKVAEAMNGLALTSLGVSEIKIVETTYPLLQALQRLIHTGPTGMAGAHFTNTTLNGIFIKDVVVLRSS